MKKLLIATTNPGKFQEVSSFLGVISVQLVGLKDLNIRQKPEETGKTFEENAILKVCFYARKSGLPTIADDGGFEIDALGGEPGVRSHRWIHGDREDEDEELIEHALKRIDGVPLQQRCAQLRGVVAFATSGGKVKTAQGIVRGVVPLKPSVHPVKGYPFRSMLFLPELGKFYFNEFMDSQELEGYNHRKKAVETLRPIIRKHFS